MYMMVTSSISSSTLLHSFKSLDFILRRLEFATFLVKRSSGCRLLQWPFAVPPVVALSKVLNC